VRPIINFNVKNPVILTRFLNRFDDVFTKPAFISFSIYVSGLFLQLKRTSIQSISANTLRSQYENLQYFISESKWDTEQLNNRRIAILQSNRATKTSNKGVLVIDDSGCKKWGCKTEGAIKQHYGTEDIITRCNVVVASAYCDGKKQYPINLRPYRPEQEFFLQKDDPCFKSKLDLAKELVQDALDKNILFSDILIDTWYFSNDFIESIINNQRTFISEAAANRLISYRGIWTHADELVKLIPQDRFKAVTVSKTHSEKSSTWYYYGFKTKLKDIHSQLLVVVAVGSWDNNDPKNIHIFVTNHLSLSPTEVIRKYALRWGIECIFRDLKENVAFDHYQVRSIKAISRHWHLAVLAYSFLLISKLNGSFSKIFNQYPKTMGQQLTFFRKLNSQCSVKWILSNPDFYWKYLGIKSALNGAA